MGAAEGYIEDKSGEGGVVVVADTGVDPRAVVVHLLDTPGRESHILRSILSLIINSDHYATL